MSYRPGETHDELCLATAHEHFTKNSIILLPNLLSSNDRLMLLQAAECAAQSVQDKGASQIRVPVLDHVALRHELGSKSETGLGIEAAELWSSVMSRIVLPFAATQVSDDWHGCSLTLSILTLTALTLPTLTGELGCLNNTCSLRVLESQVQYAVSAQGVHEPTVNRYTSGGCFPKHQDESWMSVLCLLDDQGFEGGGTDFWVEHPTEGADTGGEKKHDHPALRLHPGRVNSLAHRCTDCILVCRTDCGVLPAPGVGVVFHGRMFHAGVAVAAGTRYLLVASFRPKPKDTLGELLFKPWAFRKETLLWAFRQFSTPKRHCRQFGELNH